MGCRSTLHSAGFDAPLAQDKFDVRDATVPAVRPHSSRLFVCGLSVASPRGFSQGNAAQLATEGDFGMQQPSSIFGAAASGIQVEGAGGWNDDELENAMAKDIHRELKK
jgi:hypothetical protein